MLPVATTNVEQVLTAPIWYVSNFLMQLHIVTKKKSFAVKRLVCSKYIVSIAPLYNVRTPFA